MSGIISTTRLFEYAKEEYIEAEFITNDLVDLAWSNCSNLPCDFNFNIDLPPPIMPFPNVQHNTQNLSQLIEYNLEVFYVHIVIEFQKTLKALEKMNLANYSKQHQKL